MEFAFALGLCNPAADFVHRIGRAGERGLLATGDVLSAVAVFVGTTFLAFGAGQFALFNVALVLLWLVIAYRIGREYRRKTAVR